MSEVERSYSVSAHWDGDVETSTIKVTDSQSEREWEFGRHEVFHSDIPPTPYTEIHSVYVKFQATPEEIGAMKAVVLESL